MPHQASLSGLAGCSVVKENGGQRIYHNLMNVDTLAWRGWREIPGGGRTPSAPTVATFGNGVGVFVRGTGDGIHVNTLSSNLTNWSGWSELPDGGRTVDSPSATAGWSGFGQLYTHVAVRGTDNRVWVKTRNEATQRWTGWEAVPGRVTLSAPAIRTPTGSSDGAPSVFIRGLTNRIYENSQ